MRPEEIREDVELDRDWTPKRRTHVNWSPSRKRTTGSANGIDWAKLIALLIVTVPFGLLVMSSLNKLLANWAKDGLNLFEGLFMAAAFWLVYVFYRWLIGLAR